MSIGTISLGRTPSIRADAAQAAGRWIMGSPGVDQRKDHLQRRLVRLSSDLLTLLKHQWRSDPAADVMDAVQDAVVLWLTRGSSLELDDAQLFQWLRTTADHLLCRALLLREGRLEFWEGPEPVSDAEGIHRKILFNEVLKRYLSGRMTIRTQRAVALWAWGHTSEEIAEQVGITAANARRKVYRGIAVLRRSVGLRKPSLPEPEPADIPR